MAWIELTVHWIVNDCDLGEDYIRVLEDMLRACVLDHKGRGLIALSGIRLQQRLSGECTNGTI